MPVDDEIIEANPLEIEENTPDNPADNPVDFNDPEVGDNSSGQQGLESGSTDSGSAEQLEPDDIPLPDSADPDAENPDIVDPDAADGELLDPDAADGELLDPDAIDFGDSALESSDGLDSVSGNELLRTMQSIEKSLEATSGQDAESVEVYTDLEAFEASTMQVDLYQYTILNRLEFIQYALCIVIALLFLQIFVRYKK